MEIVRIVVFYLSDELDLKDIEKELFTSNQEKFHFFFFHNKNLHFSKDIIKYQTLLAKFSNIEPEFNFKKNEITMKKKLNMNIEDLQDEVENEFQQYKSRIQYRIDSIFQTFSMFSKLYSSRSIIYVFPFQLYENFIAYINDSAIKYNELDKNDETVKYFDIYHWINYFSKFTNNLQEDKILEEKNITKIFKLDF